MVFVRVFEITVPGAITFTGNTLGLSRSNTPGVPGTLGSIGAFITTDSLLQFGSYPPGTVSDFRLNRSAAQLRIPAGSEVQFAMLLWGGTAVSGGEDVSAFVNDSIIFQTPAGTVSVSPDPTFLPLFQLTPIQDPRTRAYVRIAEVTDLVQAGGAGLYTVGSVPGTISTTEFANAQVNSAGWTLGVIYRNNALPLRNMSLFASDSVVSVGAPATEVLVGFLTPPIGSVAGRLLVSTTEGDAGQTGDRLLFGPNPASLTVLSGPNNFSNNFFACQINNDQGLLDTAGTFGDRNAVNGAPGAQIVAGRQGWDITNVDVSFLFTNNQSEAVVSLTTNDESYFVNMIGLQIDSLLVDLTVTKTADRAMAAPGELVVYTFEVINSGEVPLHNLVIIDSLTGLLETVEQLEPGERIVFTVPFTIPDGTPGGSVILNQMVVRSDEIDRTTEAEVAIVAVPSLVIDKTADRTVAVEGTLIVYTITVVNAGNVPLTNVSLIESLGVLQPPPPFSLAIGESRSFQFSVQASGSIVQQGSIVNMVTATSNEASPATAQFIVAVISVSGNLNLQKSVTPNAGIPGQAVEYALQITNTGDTVLNDVRVRDAVLNLDVSIGTLRPSESLTLRIPFSIPSSAPPNSQISNTAIATAVIGEGPAEGTEVTSSDTALLTVLAVPELAIQKTVDRTEVPQGESVTYTITVVNLGNIDLTNVQVTDSFLSFHSTIPVLRPGQFEQFLVTLPISLTVPAGTVVTNVVTASSNETSPVEDTAFFTVIPTFIVSIVKTADRSEAVPGDIIGYTITVSNVGGETLTNIVILDIALGLNESVASLSPGESVELQTSMMVGTGAPSGSQIVNVSTVTTAETAPQSAEAIVTVLPGPLVSLTKTSDMEVVSPGDTVVYNITVQNTGNIPLTQVHVTDPMIGLDQLIDTLAVGGSQTFSVPFIVPLATPPQTVIVNTSTVVTGQTPPRQASARIAVDPAVGLTITKSADRSLASPGDTIAYSIVITNGTGVTLTNVSVIDSALQLIESFPIFAPGQSTTILASFLVPTAAAAGSEIVNTAIATSDQTATAKATAVVTVNAVPRIDIDKRVSRASAFPGERVEFAITLSNVGNVPLTGVRVTDFMLDVEFEIPLLPVGAVETIFVPFVVPIGTPTGSQIVNTAFVTTDQAATDQATSTIVTEAGFLLDVVKTVDKAFAAPRETVHYQILLRNNSNGPLVRFIDSILGLREVVTLIPQGTAVTLTIAFVIPANTPVGSQITNQVLVISDQTPLQRASATVTVTEAPQLTVLKTVIPNEAMPGQAVTFIIEIANTGNTILSPITVDDSLLGITSVVQQAPTGLIGVSGTLSVPFVIPETAEEGVIINTVDVNSAQTGTISASATLRVLAEEEE